MTPITTSGYIEYSVIKKHRGECNIADDLNQLFVPLVKSLGDADFYQYLGDLANSLSGCESCLIVRFELDSGATRLYDNLDETLKESSITPYFAGAYILDPFYTLFRNDAASGFFRLKDCAPDRFYDSEYYRGYYLNTGLVDEIGIMFRLSDKACVLVSCGNRSTRPLNTTLLRQLQSAMPVLESLCQKHHLLIQHDAMPTPLQRPLDVAFRNFGKDILSQREREVVQFILKGHSNKSIAKLLEISLDTVKVYNKRFHTKLNVSSQAELFSLFLEAISTAPLDEDVDPLAHLGLVPLAR